MGRLRRWINANRRWIVAASLLAVVPCVWRIYHFEWVDTSATVGARRDNLPADGLARSQPPFDYSNPQIPVASIRSGGPPKDGIPALSDPATVAADKAAFLLPTDRIVGVEIDGQTRAYPLRILEYHEIVNDHLAGQSIAVTYCPLCDSAAVFDRQIDGQVRELGVSGLLFNSNVLMYDRSADGESLWSQLKAAGVTGKRAGLELRCLPVELTTWEGWSSIHPTTTVLAKPLGLGRDYDRSPYKGYFSTDDLMFPVTPSSDRMPAKQRVLGVWNSKVSRAYVVEPPADGGLIIEDTLGEDRFVVQYDREADTLRVIHADEGIQWIYSLWFAWYAFHPEADIHGTAIKYSATTN